MKSTVICTVGTSLINNLRRSDTQIDVSDTAAVVRYLQNIEPDTRIMGAEINSLFSLVQNPGLENADNLFFLVSDTEDGKLTGDILQGYFKKVKKHFGFLNIEVRIVDGLSGEDFKTFETSGLKNFVSQCADIINSYSSMYTVINATGGYKAQISFAAIIAQAYGLPVYYLFEGFNKIIELPPQPIAPDLDFYCRYEELLDTLSREDYEHTEGDIDSFFKEEKIHDAADLQKLTPLIEYEEIDGVIVVTLSAIGILFHTSCSYAIEKHGTVTIDSVPKDSTPPAQKDTIDSKHHDKDIVKEYIQKIIGSPYVRKINSTVAWKRKRKRLHGNCQRDGRCDLYLTWTDCGYGINITTTGRSIKETKAAAEYLAGKYKGSTRKK